MDDFDSVFNRQEFSQRNQTNYGFYFSRTVPNLLTNYRSHIIKNVTFCYYFTALKSGIVVAEELLFKVTKYTKCEKIV